MAKQNVSAARQIAARVLLTLAIPLVFFGLIDPLEGGLALIGAALLYAIAFTLAKSKPDKVLWIPFTSTLAIGVLVLLYAMFGIDRANAQPSILPVMAAMMVYRAAVVVTLVGAVITVIRAFKNRFG